MSQLFINNFSVETLSTFAADEGYVLPLSGEAIATLDALMSEADDYLILTVTASDQSSWEIIRYQPMNTVGQYPVLRGYEGTAAVEWPSGSTISCNLTANTLARLVAGLNLTRSFEGQILPVWASSGVAWTPQDDYPYLELNLNTLSFGPGAPPVNILIDLQVWDSAAPLILRVPSGLPLRLPEGGTWARDTESGAIVLTLPAPASPDGWYRLHLAGVNNLTLDISNYVEYEDTTET